MPELPEVQTVVSTLRPHILGGRIEQLRLLRTDIVSPPGVDWSGRLHGHVIASLERRAKRIMFGLDDGNRFYIHLGMTGRLTAENADAPLLPHTHAIFTICCGGRSCEVRFRDPRRFGGFFWIGTDGDDDARLGPEPLTIRSCQFLARLAKTRRPIKSALLDQRFIAGLGNIYADEALFMAGIHPATLTDALSTEKSRRLCRAIKTVLRRAIRHRGSTLRDYVAADGAAGAFQKLHHVYGRTGEPCRVCRRPIERIRLAGRSTHFCPACQQLSRHS